MQGKPQYQEPTYRAPFRGWNTQAPEISIPQTDTPFVENWIFRNAELRTAPRLYTALPPLGTESGQPILGIYSFIDNNNVRHTVALTANNMWQLNFRSGLNSSTESKWRWDLVATHGAGASTPFALQSFVQQLYFTSPSYPEVFNWNGMANQITALTGGQFGGTFLGELGYHLLLLNTVEVSAGKVLNFANRVRWAVTGDPTIWNPATNPDAGFNDMFDVPDGITGYLPVGRVGFIFRTNGITQITLTGQAQRPFDFNHLWASEKGIGNVFPFSVGNYGSVGIFISAEEIYKITLYSFEPIGGSARDQILSDLYDATSTPFSSIVSGYHSKFIYLTYHLFIPNNDQTILWIYHVEDKNWTRRIISGKIPSASLRNVVSI